MPSFCSHYALEDLALISRRDDLGEDTPVLRAASDARSAGYETICVPLANDKWKTRWRELCLLNLTQDQETLNTTEQRAEAWRSKPAFFRDELTISRLDEAESVIPLISEWLELDASDEWVRHDAEIALQQEIAFASYLNAQCVILPPPNNRAQVGSYARAVNACLSSVQFMEFAIRVPIYDAVTVMQQSQSQVPSRAASPAPSPIDRDRDRDRPPSSRFSVSSSESVGGPSGGVRADTLGPESNMTTWEMWDTIRTICGYNPRLTLALDLTPPLPLSSTVLDQWLAEPVRYLWLPAGTFIANAKGYPVLPKGTQSFIRDIMKLAPNVILSGTKAKKHPRGGDVAYTQYVKHLEKTSPSVKAAQTAGTVENFAQGYQDYLQAPLQPLMDNLQSITYQTFEQDPIKYRNYEEAIFFALKEWEKPGRITLCVAGAGRGPLVARALNAVERAKREVFIYAVEKNPNAYVTLQERQRLEWGEEKVRLLYGDMRSLEIPEQVDILVSELLGSFGDNELSPECLDGAQRFLKPDGISIPASYTAYLAPLSSSKLFNETKASKDTQKGAETPYVVMLHAINILSDSGAGISGSCGPRIQECWEFEHPRRDAVVTEQGLPLTNSHNVRSAKLTFHIPHAGVLHGFAGYFEAVLYGNIGLSIHPERMGIISKDMLSWFPLFFPLQDPLYVPADCELTVSLWRLTDKRKVWYEWSAEAFLPVPSSSVSSPIWRDTLSPIAPHSPDASAFLSPLSSSGGFGGTPTIVTSPLLDVPHLTLAVPEPGSFSSMSLPDAAGREGVSLVKISQTALHNPGGRSSWIGL
ncbi:PRMT5-domain-containing protein [Epithele typhae]|uniref:PRMT5-domain-containing protein n=1 Tax=Epithele typhae TaxID=378194 RepID=UPI002007A7B9|nr:PRMT5-domain-containing protein [Epithele typhae]KAH9945240.1 PRMT5-domain-containing protein [Epithele typhae]